MQLTVARKLARLIRTYGHSSGRYEVEEWRRNAGELQGFHQWADHRACEGAFLVRASDVTPLWVLIVQWRDVGNFYLVLFPEPRTGPVVEIHKLVEEDAESTFTWKYKPTKRDGKNEERRTYFERALLSSTVYISAPRGLDSVEEFIDELCALAESRCKADVLDVARPLPRDGFPEGKVMERLHLARERNTAVIREAKRMALERDGSLKCQCCGFDFAAVYGRVGTDYIEGHHTRPLSALSKKGEKTKIEDIALVCANCHRMLHRRRPWLGLRQLRSLLG